MYYFLYIYLYNNRTYTHLLSLSSCRRYRVPKMRTQPLARSYKLPLVLTRYTKRYFAKLYL